MEHLKAHLEQIPKGEIEDTAELEKLLAQCWHEFVSDDKGMAPCKLHGRLENVLWEPPVLSFVIERHGGTVLGSTRATLQRWRLDIEHGVATCDVSGHRQLYPKQSPIDVKPIADGLVNLIISGSRDSRLKWSKDGQVQILSGKIFPAGSTFKNTIEGRKKRFVKALEERLIPHGWQCYGSWWKLKEQGKI